MARICAWFNCCSDIRIFQRPRFILMWHGNGLSSCMLPIIHVEASSGKTERADKKDFCRIFFGLAKCYGHQYGMAVQQFRSVRVTFILRVSHRLDAAGLITGYFLEFFRYENMINPCGSIRFHKAGDFRDGSFRFGLDIETVVKPVKRRE